MLVKASLTFKGWAEKYKWTINPDQVRKFSIQTKPRKVASSDPPSPRIIKSTSNSFLNSTLTYITHYCFITFCLAFEWTQYTLSSTRSRNILAPVWRCRAWRGEYGLRQPKCLGRAMLSLLQSIQARHDIDEERIQKRLQSVSWSCQVVGSKVPSLTAFFRKCLSATTDDKIWAQ